MTPWIRHAVLLLLLTEAFTSQSAYAGELPAAKMSPFDLREVHLLDGPFKTAMDRNAEYLLSLEPDRFLHYFRTEAGLKPLADAYGGWESANTGAGRCLGHYLSALSLQYRATDDARFKQRIDYIVDQLAEVQAANGDGYLGAEAHGKQFWAELAAGNGEALKKHRVPWYIQHKMFAGLRDAFQLSGSGNAKDVLIRLSDWAIAVTAQLDDARFQKMLDQEHGGMREVMCDVFAITHQQKYLDLARRFYHAKVIDPLVQSQDQLNGLHANTQIAKILGEARWFELTGEVEHQTASRFFWDTVVHTHTFANGGDSDEERFNAPGTLPQHLGLTTSETCNTYNMLKLTQHLFEWQPRVEYADYIERAFYNHILASIGPSPGNYTYYVPMKTGHYRTFSGPTDSFWCCVGTGMENHTKYAQSIYYHDDHALDVNLFIPSTVKWKGMTIRQETNFPIDGTVTLTVDGSQPINAVIRLRYPGWADPGATVRVNGQPIATAAKPGTYFEIDRKWSRGDRMELSLPLKLRTEPLIDDPTKIAIYYGPLLLSGQLNSVEASKQLLKGNPSSGGNDEAVPALLVSDRPLSQWLHAVDGVQLTFETHDVGLSNEVRLIPFYRQTNRRYVVYWDVAK